MGLLFGSRPAARDSARALTLDSLGVSRGTAGSSGQPATPQTSLRFSAVWAALRLRADLISTLPVDVFRTAPDGAQVSAPGTRLFKRPADDILWPEWLYSTQMDLDRYGNCFGLIERRPQFGQIFRLNHPRLVRQNVQASPDTTQDPVDLAAVAA